MIWVVYWLLFFGVMALCVGLGAAGRDNRPPTHYDGIHKVRNRPGK